MPEGAVVLPRVRKEEAAVGACRAEVADGEGDTKEQAEKQAPAAPTTTVRAELKAPEVEANFDADVMGKGWVSGDKPWGVAYCIGPSVLGSCL